MLEKYNETIEVNGKEIPIVYPPALEDSQGDILAGSVHERDAIYGTVEERQAVREAELRNAEKAKKIYEEIALMSSAVQENPVDQGYYSSVRYIAGHEPTLGDKIGRVIEQVAVGVGERMEVLASPETDDKIREWSDNIGTRLGCFLHAQDRKIDGELINGVEAIGELAGAKDKKRLKKIANFGGSILHGLVGVGLKIADNLKAPKVDEVPGTSGITIFSKNLKAENRLHEENIVDGKQNKSSSINNEGTTESDVDHGRRNFLRGALAVGAAVAVGKGLSVLSSQQPQQTLSKKPVSVHKKQEPTIIEKITNTVHVKSLNQFKWDNREYSFDDESYRCLYEEKLLEFSKPGNKMCDSMLKARKRMAPWMPRLKKIFEEVSLKYLGTTKIEDSFIDSRSVIKHPFYLAYLAIVESNWNPDDVNPKSGATGAYQFMTKTAKSYDLKINAVIDSRRDPLQSARAAAEHLFESYVRCRNWDLAISLYNGSFANRYAKKESGKLSHQGLIKYLVGGINEDKKLLKDNKCKVRGGDTAEIIARRFSMDIDDFCKLNGIKRESRGKQLDPGSTLKVMVAEGKKADVFQSVVSGKLEGIGYDLKYRAMTSALNSMGLLDVGFESLNYSEIEIKQPAGLVVDYVVKPGDTPESIARFFNKNDSRKGLAKIVTKVFGPEKVQVNDLLGFNNLSTNDTLRAGHSIKVPLRERHIEHKVASGETLEDIAKRYGVSSWHLRLANKHLAKASKFKPGQKLDIVLKPVTRETLSAGDSKRLALLKDLNPALLDDKSVIPNGHKMRVV